MPTPETRKQLENITRKNLAERFWQRGDLRYLTKPHGQRRAYDFVHQWRKDNPGKSGPIVLNTHRGMGKTVLDVILLFEACVKNPGTLAYFGSATEKDAIAIFSQTMNDPVRKMIPAGVKVEVTKTQINVRLLSWNDDDPDSVIFIVGLKEYAGTLRGRRAHIVVLDELREFDQPIDNVKSVVKPMFIEKKDPILIVTSTPPKNTAHPFTSYFVPRAERQEAYCQIKGSENEDFTEEEIEKIVDDPEDKKSIEYLREIEAELIEDIEAIMFPEFVRNFDEIVKAHQRPAFFFPFMGADLGLVAALASLWP